MHRTGVVNIEVGPDGHVSAVWFRCLRVPFDETLVSADRSAEMRKSYALEPPSDIKAVVVTDLEEDGPLNSDPHD